MELHPELKKEGGREYVVLPLQEYQQLTELMNDYEDLVDLRNAKQEAVLAEEEGVPLAEVVSGLRL